MKVAMTKKLSPKGLSDPILACTHIELTRRNHMQSFIAQHALNDTFRKTGTCFVFVYSKLQEYLLSVINRQ